MSLVSLLLLLLQFLVVMNPKMSHVGVNLITIARLWKLVNNGACYVNQKTPGQSPSPHDKFTGFFYVQ